MFYHCLNENNLFKEGLCGRQSNMKTEVLAFQEKYKNEDFYDVIVVKLQMIQKELKELFEKDSVI